MNLLSIRKFVTAINREAPADSNRIYVPHIYQPATLGKLYAKNIQLSDLFDNNAPKHDFLVHLVKTIASGKLDKKCVVIDILSAAMDISKRQENGKGLQNMKYGPDIDQFCHELLCLSPMAYRAFQKEAGARSERSVQKMRTNTPQFLQGITRQVISQAEKYLKDYQYSNELLLSLSVDDTKLLAAFRPYFDNQVHKWFIAGGIGSPIEVIDVTTLSQQLNSLGKTKATKLHLWTLQIVLPHVPPGIIAYEPLGGSNTAHDLPEMEKRILDLLVGELGLKIISLGSDGTIVECEAYKLSPPISFPLLKVHGQVMVVVQDPKHARKTMHNNLFSGAQFLILGKHPIYYEQVRKIAFDIECTPLYNRDVKKLDCQDDCATARPFSADTLAYIICYSPESIGLFIYLYAFGEMIDDMKVKQLHTSNE
ncbi:hypothetical protein BDQ17DRAFT_1433484 [Cyathus striatus]|nr:hypothetical protein BDQ17DRAFT_1433484 [Cyathus striatus]